VTGGGILGGGVKEAASDRVLVFTAAETQQASAWLVALRAMTAGGDGQEPSGAGGG
jgi:hypothetical protein